jgi:hypothetical protein
MKKIKYFLTLTRMMDFSRMKATKLVINNQIINLKNLIKLRIPRIYF